MKNWGLSTHIDLFNCTPSLIDDADAIGLFVRELCELIKMKRFGFPQIVRFGEDPRIAGYTLVQLLETSCLTAHFAPGDNNSVYIDLFSCKDFDPQFVANFCQEFFGAENYKMEFINRG